MIHPNQVRSLFLEGLDTLEIARRFSITEGEAYALMDEARRQGFRLGQRSPESHKRGQLRGSWAASVANRKAPVTLASVSLLRDVT